jgi:hypothetical protein
MFLSIEPTPSDMPPKPEPRFRTLGYIATGISGLAGIGFETMGSHPILGKCLILLSAIWATVEIYQANEIESLRPAVRGAFIVVVWTFVVLFIGPETVQMATKKQDAEAVAVYAPNPAPVSGRRNVSTDSKIPLPGTTPANTPRDTLPPTEVSTFTRQQLDDLLNSNIHQIDDWRDQWQRVQITATRLENDAHYLPPKSRAEMLSRAKKIRRDPMRAAIEPSEMRKIVATSNRLQMEVVANWLSVIDRAALPQPSQVSAIFKKFGSSDYSVGDITNLDSYMRAILRRFEEGKSTN